MTALEHESLELFKKIRDLFTGRYIKKWVFMDFMGDVVRMIKKLEAYDAGCPTGTHRDYCDCKPAVVGHNKHHKYHLQYRARIKQ